MHNFISCFISFRYLWSNHIPIFKKCITVLSILGISISVFSLIFILSLMNGFETYFKTSILSFTPHMIITNKNQCVDSSDFPKELLQNNNIDSISDWINHKVLIQSNRNITSGEIIGIDFNNTKILHQYNIKNPLYNFQKHEHDIVIGIELAKKLSVNIGDEIKIILLSKKQLFSKHLYRIQTFKIHSFFSTQQPIDYYQILISQKSGVKFLQYPLHHISGWRIWLKNPLLLNLKVTKNFIKNFLIFDWKSQQGDLFQEMQIEKYTMLFLFFLILLVSIFNILTLVSMNIFDRKNSIAILKTQGLSQWRIMLIFFIFSLSITIIGNFIGTFFSVLCILQHDFLQLLIGVFFKKVNIPIVIIPLQILFINIISLFLILIFSIYPIWKSIQSIPSKVLRDE